METGCFCYNLFDKKYALHVRTSWKVLNGIKWQDLGYLYKHWLAIAVFKVKQGLNHRLFLFFIFTESKRRCVLLKAFDVKRKETELERNNFSYKGTVV